MVHASVNICVFKSGMVHASVNMTRHDQNDGIGVEITAKADGTETASAG